MDNTEILKMLSEKKSEKEKKPRRKGGKGHEGYFKGKRMERAKFEKALDAFFAGGSIRKIWKMSGVSEPTFSKRLHEILDNGYLPDYLFTDGLPMYLTLKPPSEYTMIANELEMLDKYKG